jgi:hypothetical protein
MMIGLSPCISVNAALGLMYSGNTAVLQQMITTGMSCMGQITDVTDMPTQMAACCESGVANPLNLNFSLWFSSEYCSVPNSETNIGEGGESVLRVGSWVTPSELTTAYTINPSVNLGMIMVRGNIFDGQMNPDGSLIITPTTDPTGGAGVLLEMSDPSVMNPLQLLIWQALKGFTFAAVKNIEPAVYSQYAINDPNVIATPTTAFDYSDMLPWIAAIAGAGFLFMELRGGEK